MSVPRAFAEFEEEPLARLLEAFARAHGCPVEELRPGRLISRPGELERELAGLGLRADLTRLKTLRSLVGAVVPLLEARPRAHH
jgi:hypothetical protein